MNRRNEVIETTQKVFECIGFTGDNYSHLIFSLALLANTYVEERERKDVDSQLHCSGITITDIDQVVARQVKRAAALQEIAPIPIKDESRMSMEKVFSRTTRTMRRYQLIR